MCAQLITPKNGIIRTEMIGTRSHARAVARYACDPELYLNGHHERVCMLNSRRWSGKDPSCESTISL